MGLWVPDEGSNQMAEEGNPGPEVSPTARWWRLPDARSALESTDDKWSDQDNRFLLAGGSSQSFSA